MFGPERRGEFGDHGERGWHGGERQMPGERGLRRMNVLAHGARVADDAPRPFEHALAFRRQSVKARAAIDEQYPQCLFDLFDARRQGGLGHPAAFLGAAKIAFPRQRYQEFELVDHVAAPDCERSTPVRRAARRRATAVIKAAWLQARDLAEVWTPVAWSNCSESSPQAGV